MTDLTKQKCVPCEGGIPPLDDEKEEEYLKEVEGWSLEREGVHRIRKEFYFDNFVQSIEFVNKVADIAEEEGHHPDIYIYYDEVVLELNTHAIKGLHKNDFILAAKIDNI
ncbi:MAG: 4a-hydroxytetrahydrobiopterin dehydratase [Candidatus Thorarchaeota archaeon]